MSAAPQRVAVVGASLAGLSTARCAARAGLHRRTGGRRQRDPPPLRPTAVVQGLPRSQPRPGGALAGGRDRRPRRHLASGCPRHRLAAESGGRGDGAAVRRRHGRGRRGRRRNRSSGPLRPARASGFPGCTCCAPSTTPSPCARTCTGPSRPVRPSRSSAAGSSVPRWPRRLASSAARSPSSSPTTCRCGARWARTRMRSPPCTPPTASSCVPTPRSWASVSPTPAGSRSFSTESTPSPLRRWFSASARLPPSGGSSIPGWN